MNRLRRFLRDEEGPTSVEYAVLLVLILVGILVSVVSVGNGTGGLWSGISNAIDAAM
jgi:pilus assembly protein Flp/PilA